ncbi:universal stress protein [Variovorax sp. JS1663]|uniref:universal stress protein n=1 Tax=Variovorax sp. JS1663 TaxID=1851577 RepID=UPI000B349418|nr:universal stress protein [Variovorax sp. JS1663]OUM00910.1 universal stress protein UspA [Variovorax sp. JS1663]
MTIKTILVHLDHTPRCQARVALAAQIAISQGAHLVGLLPNGLLDGTIPAGALPSGMTDYIAQSAKYLRQRAEGIGEAFRAQLRDCPPVPHELREVEGTTLDELIAHARTSDLVVLGQDDPASPSDIPVRGLVAHVMLEAGRPVLVVPYAGRFDQVGKNVLMAWDGSRPAAVAMREALPLLASDCKVKLASFHAPGAMQEKSLLIPETVRWLGRHGVQAAVEENVVEIGIADALLSRVSDLASDLVVMGGYGHSRLREMVLGGVTREVLAQMTVPVLIAH